MAIFKMISNQIRSSDAITKMNLTPVLSTVTCVALIAIKALGDMKYTKCLVPHIAQLKYHTYKELLASMLPIVGTIYLIVSLAKQAIKAEDKRMKDQAAFLENERQQNLQRQQLIHNLKMRRYARIRNEVATHKIESVRARLAARRAPQVDARPRPLKNSAIYAACSLMSIASLSYLAYLALKPTSDLGIEPSPSLNVTNNFTHF